MHISKIERIERVLVCFVFIGIIFILSCSSSNQRNPSVVDEDNPDGASISWDDAIFGTDYFVEIEKNNDTFRFEPRAVDKNKLIERGAYLVQGIGACGSCHGNNSSEYGGGKVITDTFGEVVVPNISSDEDTGIGLWSNAEIIRALRSSLGKDGQLLSPESHYGYQWISDIDATAIAIYLKSTARYSQQLERRNLTSFDQKTLGLFDKNRDIMGYIPSPVATESPEYGRYLAIQLGGCARCHQNSEGVFSEAEPFSGNDSAPDIRGKTGRLQNWSIDDYVKYLSNGVNPKGEVNNSSICPWRYYSKMKESDKRAIAKLLKSM